MNKRVVNEEITSAYEALQVVGVAKAGKIDKTFRGQISTFGAAVSMGSLHAAIAFFSNNGGANVERSKLMQAILEVLKKRKPEMNRCQNLYEYAVQAKGRNEEEERKEEILNAAIALKLAMNLYELSE